MRCQLIELEQTHLNVAVTAGRILVVVVLYNKHFDDVPCAPKIRGWLNQRADANAGLHLAHCLVYDNSPEPLLPPLACHARMSGIQNSLNGGTRAAYLAAIDSAVTHRCPWILLLDHDTDLPADFFIAADQAMIHAGQGLPIAAVIPQVFDGGVQVSPSRITSYGRVSRASKEKGGARAFAHGLTAIASASMVRTDCLSAILPIPDAFKLDYLDHWLFRELQRRGGALSLSSAKIDHSLSVLSMQSVGLERYRAILIAERLFLRSDPAYSRLRHGLWHFLRTVKLALLTRRLALLDICWRAAQNIVRGP